MNDDLVCLCVWTTKDAMDPEKGPTEINEECPLHGKELNLTP